MRSSLQAGAGALDPLPAPGRPGLVPVVVAYVDTFDGRDEPTTAPRPRHGAAVARIGESLACPRAEGGPCAAEVWAAPVGRAPLRRPFDVARAIDEVLARYDRRPDAPRLILNISLGWVPDHRCVTGAPSQPPDTVLAAECLLGTSPVTVDGTAEVREAIERAVCRGALVIAAAGNASSPSERGPLFPGAWERVPAPSAGACERRGGPQRRGGGASNEDRPLVVSAGAVLASGSRSPLTRPVGQPRLVAFGSFAVAFSGTDPPPHLQPLAGTSVATAVTSAAASVVWAYRPDLDAAGVVDVLYRHGRATGQQADYCLQPPCGLSRMVSICDALRAACEGRQGWCPVEAVRCASVSR